MMDALEFIKQKARMCNTYDDFCSDCPMKRPGERCVDFVEEHPEEAISIVEQWAEKHPPKTRQSEFLKQFPNANLDSSGNVYICPKDLDTMFGLQCARNKDVNMSCEACRGRWWSREVGVDYDTF